MSKARRSRPAAPEISDWCWSYMNDERVDESGWDYFTYAYCDKGDVGLCVPSLQELGESVEVEFVAEWATRNPGTRPRCWWWFSAPRESWMPDPRFRPDPFPDPQEESQLQFLLRHNLLLPGEAELIGLQVNRGDAA